jgi:tRNA modification GTPase
VRLSGPAARTIAALRVRARKPLHPRYATSAEIVDEESRPIDRGLAIFFPAPASYTGEDVVELHVHGSPVIAREVVRTLIAAGARAAEPGEFTRRALFNGKIDLHQAEAIADAVSAEHRSAARAAVANLSGGLRSTIDELRQRLAAVLEEIAAAIDFPDEVTEPDAADLRRRLDAIAGELRLLLRDGEAGRLVREGVTVAIVGPPNAGKSSLLNALLGEERALVAELPGTTRDSIEENVAIAGMLVRLIDTAGIRTHADRVEAAGIERTHRALESARVALVVLDGSRLPGDEERTMLELTRQRPRVLFCNKADVGRRGARALQAHRPIVGSVRDNATLDALRDAVAAAGWGELPDVERPHLASLRELDAVAEALDALTRAAATLSAAEPPDLIAGELQRAFSALGHVTQRAGAEELLDGIFSRFCIGK